MDGTQHHQLPFNGNYISHDGTIKNIDGHIVTGDGIQHGQVPFNGNFLNSSNQIQNIDSL